MKPNRGVSSRWLSLSGLGPKLKRGRLIRVDSKGLGVIAELRQLSGMSNEKVAPVNIRVFGEQGIPMLRRISPGSFIRPPAQAYLRLLFCRP